MKRFLSLIISLTCVFLLFLCGCTPDLPTTYTATVTKNMDEAGEITGAGTYEYATTVTLTATENEGYIFDGWYAGETEVCGEKTYSFSLEADVTYLAKWTKKTYVISASKNMAEAGEVTGSNVYEHGDTVTLTATTNEGYLFDGWYEAGQKLSADATYAFTATANKTLTAKWLTDKEEYTITLEKNIAEAGNVVGGGVIVEDETITVVATTSDGYTFDGWYVSGTKVSSSASYTFTVTQTILLEAKWTINSYTVAVNKNIEGAGTTTGAGTYEYGDTVTLTATTGEGHTFLGWYVGEEKVSASATYTFTATANKALVAKWAKEIYTITLTKNVAKAGTVSGSGEYEYGEKVTLKATTKEGYSFKGWYVDGRQLSAESTYSFTADEDRTIEARWEEASIENDWSGIV